MNRHSSFWEQFQSLGKKERSLIIIILTVAFLLGLFAAFSLGQQVMTPFSVTPTQYSLAPSPTPNGSAADHADVTLSSEKMTLAPGETTLVTLSVNSQSHPIDAADFVLHYDPTLLKAVAIEPGNFFHQYPRQDISLSGTVTISAVADLQQHTLVAPKGEGVVATILFESLAPTESTTVAFDTEKTVVASAGKNITGPLSNLEFTLTNK